MQGKQIHLFGSVIFKHGDAPAATTAPGFYAEIPQANQFMLDQNQTAVLFARKLKRLNQQSPGQGYANLFRLALGYDAQSPEVKKPAHLPGYGALRDRKALCDIATIAS